MYSRFQHPPISYDARKQRISGTIQPDLGDTGQTEDANPLGLSGVGNAQPN